MDEKPYNVIATAEKIRKDNLEIALSDYALVVELLKIVIPLLLFVILISTTVLIFKNDTYKYILDASFLLALLIIVGSPLVLYYKKKLWKNQYYTVTPVSLKIVSGVLNKKHSTHSLKGVTSLSLKQNLIMKAFHYGTIKIYFMGGSSVEIQNIPHPNNHLELIQQLIDKGYIEE